MKRSERREEVKEVKGVKDVTVAYGIVFNSSQLSKLDKAVFPFTPLK